MATFSLFKRKPPEALVRTVIDTREYKALRDQYIELCNAVLGNDLGYSTESARNDFDVLSLDERVAGIAVNPKEHMLILGTREVIIEHEQLNYRIGTFIIKITRLPKQWTEYVAGHVHYERVTGITANPSVQNIHPHISAQGGVCMQEGKNRLADAASRGDLATAAYIALSALWIFDKHPMAQITEWPLVTGGSHA